MRVAWRLRNHQRHHRRRRCLHPGGFQASSDPLKRPETPKQQVRRGVYHDVPELIAAIESFIAGYNQRAQPFVWTKTAESILAKADKRQATSGTLH